MTQVTLIDLAKKK